MAKRILILVIAFCVSLLSLRAQGYIPRDLLQATKLKVKAALLDEKTGEPVSFASVYLIPKGDSVISHFTISDSAGVAIISDITKGSYTLKAEFMGYKSFQQEFFFQKETEDIGTIKMVQDLVTLEAAQVSAAGNAIQVKQDTIIYNASSFMVSKNAMLGDLLKRMPGIEVTDKGDVKVGGKSVSKITVNGRTFFFEDKSAALNNLPAEIVDKVSVIDQESESAKFTGILDMEKEKVIDVSLKKEYEQGWFGNATAMGGSTVIDKNNSTPLVDGRGLLYRGNTMMAAYSKESQLTVIANAGNVVDEEGAQIFAVYRDDDNDGTIRSTGLPSNYMAAANLSTEKVKGFNTSLMLKYGATQTVSANQSSRETFLHDGSSLFTESSGEGNSSQQTLKTSIRFQKMDQKKYLFGSIQ